MGDSDDEYDRKRRDKFRGERTESYPRGDGRRTAGDERRREDWIERDFQRSRGTHPRGEYREYRGGGGRERYSPSRSQDMVPPVKRVRTDWGEERRMGGYGHEGGSYDNYSGAWQHYSNYSSPYANANASRSSGSEGLETQPAMLSFKSYLQTQDDNITDEEALRKYNEYKLEFKRQQLNEFFVTHKEEEWFKIKYHPEEGIKRKEEQTVALKNRVKVFLDLMDSGRFDKISVDTDKTEELIKLLDIVVICLEGGTEADIQALELRTQALLKEANYCKQEASEKSAEESTEKKLPDDQEAIKSFVLDDEEEPKIDEKDKLDSSSEPMTVDITEEHEELQFKAKEFIKLKSTVEGEPSRDYSDTSDSELSTPTGDINGVSEEPPPPGLDEEKEPEEDDEDVDKTEGETEEGQEEQLDIAKDAKSDNGAEDISDKEDEPKEDKDREDGEEPMEIDDLSKEKSGQSTPESIKPKCLHRTSSIFLRNLAPTITKQEVEAMCKRYPGFLRVAIADPQPERRWFRRGWVTFQRHVNIKDICWNLNNIRLRDCELGAIVNRDLTRRIRTVNGITCHKEVIRNDIKLAARMVHNLDSRAGLWSSIPAPIIEDEKKAEEWHPSFGLESKNPVLKNITDYLIEDAPAEEEELLGITADSEEGQIAEEGSNIVRDENLIRVLDKLLMYLRIVHSVDYYNHCEYPNEDEMPNRTGIMHARGIPPSKQVSPQEISDYCTLFEQKIASFLQPIPKLSDEEYCKLGHKDPDAEVEKFVKSNTQELAKDKWLCPLSGKKFKGPEFVRKHIFNKHAEKVDEVKKEVEYFNNFLRDPKRPQLPEHPGSRTGGRKEGPPDRETFSSPMQPYMQPQYTGSYGGGGGGGGYGHRHGGFVSGHGYPGPYSQGYNQGYSTRPNRGGYRGRGGGADFRPVIHYRDLDAPREPEEFI